MLSRRSIRVKVMQVLFMMSKDPDLKKAEAIQYYDSSIEEAYKLYLLNLYTIILIAKCSIKDAEKRHAKHLPSEEDKSFSSKLYNNNLVQSLVTNKSLNKKFEKYEFEGKIDQDLINRLYKQLSSEDAYKRYILSEPTDENHIAILHELYRICRKDEIFDDLMEDLFSSWLDDKSLVIGAIKKTLKSLPVKGEFYKDQLPDDETVNLFGRELLDKVISDEEYLKSLVEPVLENWDSDRVALVDMLFLKMAICEFLNFVTIPTKVTLNEYVELSKVYSTERSKDFINGVLDNLMKMMTEEGMIKKEGRGLLA